MTVPNSTDSQEKDIPKLKHGDTRMKWVFFRKRMVQFARRQLGIELVIDVQHNYDLNISQERLLLDVLLQALEDGPLHYLTDHNPEMLGSVAWKNLVSTFEPHTLFDLYFIFSEQMDSKFVPGQDENDLELHLSAFQARQEIIRSNFTREQLDIVHLLHSMGGFLKDVQFEILMLSHTKALTYEQVSTHLATAGKTNSLSLAL